MISQDLLPQVTVPQVNDPLGVITTAVDADIAPIAITMGTKPDKGTTEGEPFPKGAGGSNSFRIPALVTLKNGNLLAAADARWNTTYDGGGLDTIVSISTDGGMNWSYQFANYLGDNGNEYNGTGSTTFIDPALAVTGNTVYMLVDIYPYGVALNGNKDTAPVAGTGFNSNGKLLLSGNNHSSYNYYLDGNTIYGSDGQPVSGYTVDEYFNITSMDGSTNSNLFFSDSPFKVVRTGFLYLTKSTDGGKTWSAPELLNLKTSSELVCLVGPGRGLVTSDGKVIFPVYSYSGSDSSQKMGFISYNGKSWSRSTSMTGATWSSESAVVELTGGTLRFFYRNGTTNLCYVDYNNGWGTPVVMNGSNGTETIDTNSNCQISAITYSKTVDGKKLILVSCPTGPNEEGSDQSGASYRLNGKIFAFTVEADGSLKKAGAISVTSNNAQFMYSCLTELADGTVGILYEDHQSVWGTGSNCYYTMSYVEYDLAASMKLTFDSAATEPSEPDTDTDITVADEAITVESATEVTEIAGLTNFVAYDVTLTKDGADYKGAATITIPLNGKFAEDGELWGFVLETDGTVKYVKDAVRDYEKDTLTFLAPHFSIVGGTPAKAADVTITNTVNVRIPVGGTSEVYIDETGSYNLTDTNEFVKIVAVGKSSNGYEQVTTINDITSGAQYWIECDRSSELLTSDPHQQGGLTLAGSITSKPEDDLWTVTYENGHYRIAQAAGALNFDKEGGADLNGTADLSLVAASGSFRINETGFGLNNYGGTWYHRAAGHDNKTDGGNLWNFYKKTSEASTEVKFTGLKAGTTTAVVGTTQYNITVYKEVDVKINYTVDGKTVATGTVKAASDSAVTATVTLPNTVTDGTNTYRVNNTTLTLKDGVNATYSVPVTLVEGTEISIRENETAELEVELSDGQYVVWTTADSTKVAVAGEYDAAGKATGNGIILGHNITDTNAPVLVVGTVHNADGSVAGAYKWLVTVTEGTDNINNTSKYIYINIDRIQNTTVYYNINGGELIEITDDMLDPDSNGSYYKLKVPLMDEQYNQGFQISFFAAPHEGYALVDMSSTNSAKQYYTLSDGNPDGVGSDAWPFAVGYNYDAFDSLTTKPAGNNTSVFNTAKGIRWGLVEGNFTVAQMKMMFANAISKGCDGVLVFTKNNNGTANGSTTNYGDNDLVTDLSFISTPLPEVSKSLNGVLPTTRKQADFRRYNGTKMTATVGEYVYFNVTVTLEKPAAWVMNNNTETNTSALEFTTATVIDKLNGAYFYTKDQDTNYDGVIDDKDTNPNPLTQQDIKDRLNTEWTAAEKTAGKRVIELYVVYPITAADLGNKIVNTVTFDYSYSSRYSSGEKEAMGQAVADILVTGGSMPSYVIDFGQPVVITDDANNTFGFRTAQAQAAKTNEGLKYGTVAFAENESGLWTMTYTPTTILQGAEKLYFYDGSNNIINTSLIYPATTVYYEEGFLFNENSSSTWNLTNAKKATLKQTLEQLNAHENVFGYDPIYATSNAGSAGSYAVSNTVGDTTSFTFTGTGFQLYANSDTGSGIVSVYNKGGIQRIYTIDTGLKVPTAGKNGSTISPNGLVEDIQANKTYYSLPVVSETNLPYGTYVVTIRHTKDSKPIYLDGVRIFNTVEDSTIFTIDEEDNPVFHELRDYVLKAIGVEDLTESDYIGGDDNGNDRQGKIDAVKDMAGQVYNAGIDGNAVVINVNGKLFNGQQAQELLDDGPKNELYLYPGQTLVFSVTTDRVLQLGLKSPIGDAKFTITVDGAELDLKSLSTTVDMFYKIAAKGGTTHNVTITVNSGVLSVTTLKVCDDPNFSFNTLTQEDIENALLGIFGLDEVENPFVDVVEDDFFFDAVLWAHENGITNGMDDTHFIPTGMCNRAQIVTFLWRAMGKPAPTTTVNPFVDVTESDFFYDAVLWAHENGITNGVDATHFNPTGECNRAQAVTFLWRAVGEPESTADVDFTDVQPGQFYSAAVAWAFEKGITNGMDDGTFGVLESCNRAQVVTFLYRALAPR